MEKGADSQITRMYMCIYVLEGLNTPENNRLDEVLEGQVWLV